MTKILKIAGMAALVVISGIAWWRFPDSHRRCVAVEKARAEAAGEKPWYRHCEPR